MQSGSDNTDICVRTPKDKPGSVIIYRQFPWHKQKYVQSYRLWGIDPPACTIRSLISTNHRHEMLLFLAQIVLSHTLVSQTVAGHTPTQCSFVIFGSVTVSQQNGSKGAPRVINLEQFPVQISKTLTPLPAVGILFCLIFLFSFFFFFYFCHSPSPPPPPPPLLFV